MSRVIENVDYVIEPDLKDDPKKFDCVRILQEPYTGIVFRVGMLRFSGSENADGTLTTKFDYQLVAYPYGVSPDALREDRRFNKLLGDITITILCDQLDEKEFNGREFEAREL